MSNPMGQEWENKVGDKLLGHFNISPFANEGSFTWLSGAGSDGAPNALQGAVKMWTSSCRGTIKATGELRGERTCLWPCQRSPHSELLVYYCPRKRVITTGHLPD